MLFRSVFGILLSIPIIIFASKALIKLLDKFPILMYAGAAMIAWVGASMMVSDDVVSNYIGDFTGQLICGMATVLAIGTAFVMKKT